VETNSQNNNARHSAANGSGYDSQEGIFHLDYDAGSDSIDTDAVSRNFVQLAKAD